MKRALLILFSYTFISHQAVVCKAQDNDDGMAPLMADPNASTFRMTWPGADAEKLTGPAGLIDRLPPDGTWARFEQDDTFVTIASVGKIVVDEQPCRWIEVILGQGGLDFTWKLLIQENCPNKGRNIAEQALSVWHCKGREEPLNITGMSPADEFGSLTFILTGPDKEVRSLEPQVVETELGRFECAGWTGRQFTKFDQQEIDATYRQLVHESAPFGVLRSELEYTIKFDGRVVRAKESLTLVEAGTGARSRISTANRSAEELTAQPFAPSVGWRWALPPENCNWGSMATRGLAMSIDRSDEEFRFTFAHPSLPMPGGAQYRAVAFDSNQRRYEFGGVSGGASGKVGLKIFTLANEILSADQVKYVGIEKQSCQMSKEPPSLMGKSLPDFTNIRFNFVSKQTDEKVILICFFDMDQRPSRNYIGELAKRAKELKEQGVIVIAIQALKADENKLDEWIKKNNISFPVGIVQGDAEKVRFSWGVKSLPRLILTNDKHYVVAEGFNLKELDNKLKQLGDK